MPQLIEEIAYEQWHRMLFARFLAENDLLMHPDGVAGHAAGLRRAGRRGRGGGRLGAGRPLRGPMLPGIFRADDPAAQVRFAPEGRQALEELVQDLPPAVFTADDALGWVYQFWQTKKKDEVNASERKIGGADLAPVTQLFTEDYMVRFLLENSLGAWWAARHPDSPLLKTLEYLRFRDDGTPAAGTFPGWPERAAEVTVHGPLRRLGPLPRGRVRDAAPDADGGRGAGRGRGRRRGHPRQPLHAGARPALHADRRLRPGARRLEGGRLSRAAGAQHRLLRHRGGGAARRLAEAGRRGLRGCARRWNGSTTCSARPRRWAA